MKIFYINNSLCEGCDDCSVACPVAAVYVSGGKHYISHEKCTSCGACIRTCGNNAVSIESVDGMISRMENADLYLSRIRRLEKEMADIKGRLEHAENNTRSVMEATASAMAIYDKTGRILARNSLFDSLAGRERPSQAGTDNYLTLSGILPGQTARLLVSGHADGEGISFTDEVCGRSSYIKYALLSDGNYLCVIDDITRGPLAAARIAEALRSAVDRQMDMVRTIGTILGDEASSMLEDINGALELIRAAENAPKDDEQAAVSATEAAPTGAQTPDNR